jgi:uncharacterized membrane protein YciS (DUF1049 family)
VVAAQYIVAVLFAVGSILVFVFWFIPKRKESEKLARQIEQKKKKKD